MRPLLTTVFVLLQLSYDKSAQRFMTTNGRGPTVKKTASKVSTYKLSNYTPVGSVAHGQVYSSRSEPGLAWQHSMQKSSATAKRHPPTTTSYQRQVSKSQSQYLTNTRPQPLPAPAINGTGPSRAKSQFLCNPVNVSTTMSKPPVVEFAQATLKEASG